MAGIGLVFVLAGGLASPLAPAVSLITGDLKSAIDQAKAVGDANGEACWTAIQPLASAISPNLPLTFRLAADIERFRAIMITLHKVCETPACTQVLQEAANGIGALGVGIAPPSLAGLCAKVPPIAPGGGGK